MSKQETLSTPTKTLARRPESRRLQSPSGFTVVPSLQTQSLQHNRKPTQNIMEAQAKLRLTGIQKREQPV